MVFETLKRYRRDNRRATVSRVVALPREEIRKILLARGISISDVAAAESYLEQIGSPYTAEAVVDYSFIGRPKFSEGRFSDGSAPVYWSALEIETAQAEVAYYARQRLQDGLPREYCRIDCMFSGFVYLLWGYHFLRRELVSKDKSGYSFCQRLANELRKTSEALFTPSARRSRGTCVPVFVRSALTNATRQYWIRLVLRQGKPHFERI